MQEMGDLETHLLQSAHFLPFCNIYRVVIFLHMLLLRLGEAERMVWFKVTHCKVESFTPTVLVTTGWLGSD